ncbi:MAG: hypothetical protein HQ558_01010 [Candidatus Omnitrophica bacterium]|nr:hypothetical protein [Candidatus Omnitrophota bacterium]
MRKLIPIIVVIVAIGFTVIATKDIIIRSAVIKAIHHTTGLKVSVKGLKTSLHSGIIDVTGLKVYNPSGFHDKIMADIPLIYMDADLKGMLKGRISFNDIKIHLNEFTIIRDEKGQVNVNSIKTIKEKEKPEPEKKAAEPKPLNIDLLQLKIGSVIYKDYSKGDPPLIRKYALNIDEKYKDVKDLASVVNIIVAKAMKKAALEYLLNFDISKITGHLPSVLKESAGIVSKGASSVTKAAGEGVSAATNTVKKATGAFSEMFHMKKSE